MYASPSTFIKFIVYKHSSLLSLLIVSLFSWAGTTNAQDIRWADKLLQVSSEYKNKDAPRQFLGEQVLGPPSILPSFGTSGAAWGPSQPAAEEESIAVRFNNPSPAQQVIINETLNAGAITKIRIGDGAGRVEVIYENDNPQPVEGGRLFQVRFPRTDYPVAVVAIILRTDAVKGYNQIDAIGLADHQEDVEVRINTVDMEGDLKVENLGTAVNSPAMELAPIISPDGRSLYFVRQNHPQNTRPHYQNIWIAPLNKEAQPQPAKNPGAPLNGNLNSGLLSISPDGQTALVNSIYVKEGRSRMGISISQRQEGGWGFPQALNIKNYYNDSPYGEACMSSSGQVLIFSIQRKEAGAGSKDLFVSFKEGALDWSEPKWMGPTINSGGKEAAPFLAADGKSLYFASEGHPGYGDMDVFVSRRLDDSWTNWSTPQNLGKPLNTDSWDAYYSLPASGDYVYLISSKEGGFGQGDIYRAKLPEALRPEAVVLVSGTVRNVDTQAPIATEISYYSLDNGELMGTANSDPETGAYSIVLPAGAVYGFSAQKGGFIPVSENVDLTSLKTYEERQQDLSLQPLREGAKIVLNNIYFDSGKASLRSSSKVELDQLLHLLEGQESLQIEIGGHTDDVGSDTYNQELSERRAKAVVDYLIESGIESAQLQAKGYGEAEPRVKNDSDTHRQQNRRVEFRVLAL